MQDGAAHLESPPGQAPQGGANANTPVRLSFAALCAQCGDVHPPGVCMLSGMRVFPARHKAPCEMCKEPFKTIKDAEDAGEPRSQADLITAFGDLGYVHRDCLVPVLKLYKQNSLLPLETRVNQLCVGVPSSVADLFKELTLGEQPARATIIKAVPGSGKSYVLRLLYYLLGIRNAIVLTFNTTACSDLRAQHVEGAFTHNALGMRGASAGVLPSIMADKAAGLYTPAEAPQGLQLTLVKSSKVTILVHMMYPPVLTVEADGLAARVSLHFRVCSQFLNELYPLALANAFGVDDEPSMEDVGALMTLALNMKYDQTLEKCSTTLPAPDQARWAQLCGGSTPASRLAYACALVAPLHNAHLQTATRATWTTPSGVKVLYIKGPGVRDPSYKLPAICFPWQTSLMLYNPEKCKIISGTYSHVLKDEMQDDNKAREKVTIKIVQQSDINGGPGHVTKVTVVGDDDQSITGWNGGLQDPFGSARVALSFLGLVRELSLPWTLRPGWLLVDYAEAAYTNTYTVGYAMSALYKPPADRVAMLAAPGAIKGVIETNINFHKYPLPLLAQLGKTILCARRHVTLSHLYDLTVSRDIPCCYMKQGEELIMPLKELLSAVDLCAGRMRAMDLQSTTAHFLEVLPFCVGISAPIRSCLVVRTHAYALVSDVFDADAFKDVLSARYSKSMCRRLELMSSHAVKGKTCRLLVKVQPDEFPLPRSVTDGGIFLAQEPKVEYVVNTRATHALLEAQQSMGSEDNDLENTLFPLDEPIATELPYALRAQVDEDAARARMASPPSPPAAAAASE